MDKFLDNYTISVSKVLLGKNLWFNEDTKSKAIKEHIDLIEAANIDFSSPGFYEAGQKSTVGLLDTAYHVAKWIGSEYPTIIYHHGNNESPFKFNAGSKNTFKSILHKEQNSIQANLISLRAPYHNSGMKIYMKKISYLDNFSAMLAGYDQFIRFEIQKQSYDENQLTVLDKGHVTCVMSPGLIRNHILSF